MENKEEIQAVPVKAETCLECIRRFLCGFFPKPTDGRPDLSIMIATADGGCTEQKKI